MPQLLDLLNGIRPREFSGTWCFEEDLPRMTKLIEACSDTLEYVDIKDDTCSKFVLSVSATA